MGTALLSLGIGLTWAWIMTVLDWDHLARRRTRTGWPKSELQWFLPFLVAATAAFAWGAWSFFAR